MNNKDLLANIKKATSKSESNFAKKAKFRIENKKWLDYSSNIAYRILSFIEDNPKLSQTSIANSLNKTRQHVNKILKGDQNLTLKTIGQLSDILGHELIEFPKYKDSYQDLSMSDYSEYIESLNKRMFFYQDNNFNTAFENNNNNTESDLIMGNNTINFIPELKVA